MLSKVNQRTTSLSLTWRLFYYLRPIIPRGLQIGIRRKIVAGRLDRYRHVWPIDPDAGGAPSGWVGWPGGKRFAFILQHDVDTQFGHDRCGQLMQAEKELGFRSCFNFVPERYTVSASLREELLENGFEVGVHGLKHDGKLFSSKRIFAERAERINDY